MAAVYPTCRETHLDNLPGVTTPIFAPWRWLEEGRFFLAGQEEHAFNGPRPVAGDGWRRALCIVLHLRMDPGIHTAGVNCSRGLSFLTAARSDRYYLLHGIHPGRDLG
jgi:hypothetical protein